jgi:hypothetical protein
LEGLSDSVFIWRACPTQFYLESLPDSVFIWRACPTQFLFGEFSRLRFYLKVMSDSILFCRFQQNVCPNVRSYYEEDFDDTKGFIRIRKSKKDKRTNNDLQNIHIKLKIEQHEPN